MRKQTWLERIWKGVKNIFDNNVFDCIWRILFDDTPLGFLLIILVVLVGLVWLIAITNANSEISIENYIELKALATEYPNDIRPMVLEFLESENKITESERSAILVKHKELEKSQILHLKQR